MDRVIRNKAAGTASARSLAWVGAAVALPKITAKPVVVCADSDDFLLAPARSPMASTSWTCSRRVCRAWTSCASSGVATPLGVLALSHAPHALVAAAFHLGGQYDDWLDAPAGSSMEFMR